MSNARWVVVLGSVNRDLVMTIDALPSPGETVTGGVLSQHWGGKGANQAVAARRWGAEVLMLAAVGDDDVGVAAVADLQREGVDTEHVKTIQGMATGTAFVLVDRDGSNLIAVASGANAHAGWAALSDIAGPAVGLTCFEIPMSTVTEAVRLARRHDWPMIVNPAPAQALPDGMEQSGIILTPNGEELRGLTGVSDVEAAARKLCDFTAGPVVATLGGDGALLATHGEVHHIPAPDVRVVDTTGAGDAFNGVLAAALARGAPLLEAAGEGVRAASASVSVEGAREGMPRRSA